MGTPAYIHPNTEEINASLSRRPYVEQLAVHLVLKELDRATAKHPEFAQDIVHGAAIVCEEAGEVAKAAIDYHYHGGCVIDVSTEAIHTAATAIRLLINLPGA